jgi:hypothetical protein
MRVFTPISTHLMWLVIFFVLSPIASAVTPAQLAAESEYQDAKISPDGKHIALVISKDGRRKLAVVKSSNFKAVGGADFGDKEEVGEIYWANNERIVIEVLINEPWDDRARFYGELYAIDYNGKRGVMLYGHRAGERSIGTKMPKRGGIVGHAEIISLLPNEEDQILISSRPQSANGGRTATVHRLNVKSGKMSNMVAGSPMSYGKFMADNSGSVKIAYGIDKDYHRRVIDLMKTKGNTQRLIPEILAAAGNLEQWIIVVNIWFIPTIINKIKRDYLSLIWIPARDLISLPTKR